MNYVVKYKLQHGEAKAIAVEETREKAIKALDRYLAGLALGWCESHVRTMEITVSPVLMDVSEKAQPETPKCWAIWNNDKQEMVPLNGVNRIFGDEPECIETMDSLRELFPRVEYQLCSIDGSR